MHSAGCTASWDSLWSISKLLFHISRAPDHKNSSNLCISDMSTAALTSYEIEKKATFRQSSFYPKPFMRQIYDRFFKSHPLLGGLFHCDSLFCSISDIIYESFERNYSGYEGSWSREIPVDSCTQSCIHASRLDNFQRKKWRRDEWQYEEPNGGVRKKNSADKWNEWIT